MSPTRAALLLLCYLISFVTYGQRTDSEILLRTGPVSLKNNIHGSFIDSFNRTAPRFSNKTTVLLRFASIPTAEQRKRLSSAGIELHNYLSGGVYSAIISGNIDAALLEQADIKSLVPLKASQKIDPLLAGGKVPAHIVKIPGTIDVNISFPRSFSYTDIIEFLAEKNIDIISNKWLHYGKLSVRLAPMRLQELASFPFIDYVGPVGPDIELFNHKSRQGSRANVLSAAVSDGGFGLNGEGVTIGIGDNSAIMMQADFSGRCIERNVNNASHGIHVAGTAAGGGIVNELYRGYASKATIVNAMQDDIVSPVYVQDHNMVLTNNSYGGGFICEFNGAYDFACAIIDDMAFEYPSLLHIYGAGNYGTNTCAPYPAGFNTISALWQSAKNVITVGGTNDSLEMQPFSSKGPAKDGRIKPEIVAMGLQVTSTWPTNIYSFNSGTSMSAPAITGGLTLLYQRYRQLHSGADPKNGLMKAILCNGATDKGNAGPDYSYGFGVMNLLRSIDMLNKQHHFTANATHNSNKTHTISVPAGTAQLKVMLYWNDPGGAHLAPKALVNDLDLEVTTPASATVLPLILDALPANVNNPAVNGVDRLNNIEQVVIHQPAPGNYTLRVKGTTIAQNPSQEYFLVYDIVPVSVTLTYPTGSEGMVPGEFVKISWDAFGNTDKTFNLQFSPDNGATWTNIANNLAAARRIYTWQVPSIVTSNALIRIVQNETLLTSTSRPFTIIGLPVVSLSPIQCQTYIAINWTAVAGADHYEVMLLNGDEMQVIATTSSTSYKLVNLSKENLYWISVRPVVNGRPGRRAVAISRRPDNGNCSGTISDNDLAVEALISPVTGRRYTSMELRPDHTVTVRIRNLDDAPANGFTLSYAVNGNWTSENVAVVIPAGGTYDHSFSTTVNLSETGTYNVRAVVKNNNPDPAAANDTLVTAIRNLDNQPIDLSGGFLDNLETAASATYIKDTVGLSGIDRYDFESATKSGQVMTFVNSGFAYSGTKAFVVGETWQHAAFGLNYVTGTFNLSEYDVNANNLRADFQFVNTHFAAPNDAFWVRGSDNMPWIRMSGVPRTDTLYRRSASMPIGDSLAAHGQQFTGSFQMRWSQSSIFQSMTKRRMYAVDDVRLYQVVDDMQALRIDTPSAMNCAMTGNVPVKVTLHNSHFTALNNIPIKYSVNGGQWVEEFVPAIPAKATFQYTFNQPLNITAYQTYKLKVVVSYPTDNFRDNDTAQLELQNSTLIASFPYLQNFESGSDGWYANGQNSSWAYGTPASEKIKGAASGTRAWKTSLNGNHNDNELSYLYTPCFNLSGLSKPTVSFSIALDIAACQVLPCDGVWLEASVNGINWGKIGFVGLGTNWYNSAQNTWNGLEYTRWHVATTSLTPSPAIRFRFVFSSNSGITREGVAIDDFHIYDNEGPIYDSVTMPSAVTETLAGNGWTHFRYSNKLLASVHPGNQSIGAVDAQVYIHTPGVRNTSTQYYHNRNLTLKTANAINDSAIVRFYFLDSETDSLIFAKGCAGCSKPANAYQLGVSTYNDAVNDHENGTIDDNGSGDWAFINSHNVAKVPYDKGYYAEFRVKEFSEFWLNNGGIDLNAHLAIQLLEFTAQRSGDRNAFLHWKMGDENGIIRYEIELARDRAAMQANQFMRIGQVQAQGGTSSTSYDFTDTDPDKFDTVYYRLKMVYNDGRSSYSPVRAVVFDKAVTWTLYPNPSPGRFYLDYPGISNERMQVNLFDAKGSLVKSFYKQGNGFMQKLVIDLSNNAYPPGVYLLRVSVGNTTRTFKLYKQ